MTNLISVYHSSCGENGIRLEQTLMRDLGSDLLSVTKHGIYHLSVLVTLVSPEGYENPVSNS